MAHGRRPRIQPPWLASGSPSPQNRSRETQGGPGQSGPASTPLTDAHPAADRADKETHRRVPSVVPGSPIEHGLANGVVLAITFGTAAKTHPNFDAKERVTMLADGLD